MSVTATLTGETSSTQDATPAAPSRPRFNWRRMLIPLGAAAAIMVFTIVTIIIESPSPGSDSFLSPQSKSDDGSSILADALRGSGIEVDRHTDPQEAFTAATAGDTTVFIPAPEYLNSTEWYLLSELRNSPRVRVVLVMPPAERLSAAGLYVGGERIATKTVGPEGEDEEAGCQLPEAKDAGEAAILRQRYTVSTSGDLDPNLGQWSFCYGNGLAANLGDSYQEIVAGAPDAFSNAHITEAGNQRLATGLLGTHSSVVWLDHHSLTPQPAPDTGSPSHQAPSEGSRPPIQYPEAQDPSPVYSALPQWLWAGLVGLVVLGAGMALWRGRRLGPPVTEPLPVTVPAAETVHGRARLYRRAHAYQETLRALRSGALHRIRPMLRLSSQATDTEVVTAAAARTGWQADQVTAILYSAQPTSEPELLATVNALDALVAAVETASPQGRDQ